MIASHWLRAFALALAIVAVVCGEGCGKNAPANPGDTARTNMSPAPEKPVPLPQTQPAAAPATERAAIADEPHDAQPSAACLAKTNDAGARAAASIHRWVDGAGVTHYSDQAPVGTVSEHRVLEVAGLPPVKVEASGYDVNLPADVERRAIVDALAVQRVFHETLGVDAPSDTVLRIVFVGDASHYAALVGNGTPAASSGAYVPDKHTIYVRMQADDETAFSILRHEITHALIHEEVGNLPVTLNEGLAEYFRRYRAAGMGGQIDIGADRAGLVGAAPAGDGGDALVELLALTGPDFYAADRERRYLQAYALVAVLMRGSAEAAALRDVLAAQRGDPCVPVAAETLIEHRYPGGLAALSRDWAELLRQPPPSIRAY